MGNRILRGADEASRGREIAAEARARIPAVAFQNVVGSSHAIRDAIALGCKIASHPAMTVLLRGETGTGKELFARGIHYSSENASEPFVAINCAAIPEDLLESELFGHEPGAFTGASSQKRGLLEFAERGTVFLDEIGELPITLQPKLLRVLEEKRVRRLGGFRENEIKCRVITATNRDLAKLVTEGHFREDLYYRLSVFQIEIPALRDREEDVELLARYFLESFCREKGVAPKSFSADGLAVLRNYRWPGNVRELKNAVEGAAIMTDSDVIGPDHLLVRRRSTVPAALSVGGAPVSAVIPIPESGLKLDDAERQLIEATMRMTNNNQSRAARMLGISRPTIIRKLRRYGLLALAALMLLMPRDTYGQRTRAPQRPQTAQRGGTLVIAGTVDLRQMNSLVANEAYTSEVMQHMLFMTLVRLTPELSFSPYLASSWRMIGDTAVVFNLRRDVFWHDGAHTTAYDVAFTFNTAKNPETAFPDKDYFERWDRVTVVDSFTVRFHFQPHPEPLMGLPFTAIMPRHLLDTIPPARMRQAAFNRNPVGNGPFRFVSYRANSQWVFEANPRFPAELGGRPYLDRIVWRVVPDNTAKLTELLTGNADIITAPGATSLKALDARPELRVLVKPSRKYQVVLWNGKHAPLDDARVRRALTLGIDRQKMITVLRGGYALVASGPIPPYHWAYDPSVKALPYDPAAARALLAAAGLRDTDGDGFVETADGKPFTLELKTTANNEFNRDFAEMMRSDLEKVGVKLAPRPVDFATMIQDISSPQRNFEGALLAVENDFRLNLRDSFHSAALGGPQQSASYSNPAVDRLIDRASTTMNRAAAKPVFRQIQQILRDDSPWAFLWYIPDLIAMNTRVRGADMDIRGIFVNAPRWWIADAARRRETASN